MIFELFDDVIGFVYFILSFVAIDLAALPFIAAESLFDTLGIVGDDAIGYFEDGAGGAVVFFEFDQSATCIVFLKTENNPEVSFAPRVDRLVDIADHHERALVPESICVFDPAAFDGFATDDMLLAVDLGDDRDQVVL